MGQIDKAPGSSLYWIAIAGTLWERCGWNGEVSEWFKETVLKTVELSRLRGFESHLLRCLG